MPGDFFSLFLRFNMKNVNINVAQITAEFELIHQKKSSQNNFTLGRPFSLEVLELIFGEEMKRKANSIRLLLHKIISSRKTSCDFL